METINFFFFFFFFVFCGCQRKPLSVGCVRMRLPSQALGLCSPDVGAFEVLLIKIYCRLVFKFLILFALSDKTSVKHTDQKCSKNLSWCRVYNDRYFRKRLFYLFFNIYIVCSVFVICENGTLYILLNYCHRDVWRTLHRNKGLSHIIILPRILLSFAEKFPRVISVFLTAFTVYMHIPE